jgi:hypothetical protein
MQQTNYHKKIIEYYKDTENAYKDSWDLNNSLSIHYGYWDEKVKSFPQSLLRMNEVMMEAAAIRQGTGCRLRGRGQQYFPGLIPGLQGHRNYPE